MNVHPVSNSYRLVVDVVAPLCVGSGDPALLPDFDYVLDGERIAVIDPRRALRCIPNAADLEGGLLASAVPPEHRPEASAYSLPFAGGPLPGAIFPAVKDVSGQPYLPGSAVKGALRTLLTQQTLDGEREAGTLVRRADLAPVPRYASQPLERRLFGQTPESSAARALKVSDCSLRETGGLAPAATRVYGVEDRKLTPESERAVAEVLEPGARLVGQITIDRAVLGDQSPIGSERPVKATLADVVGTGQAAARRRVAEESEYFRTFGIAGLAEFYDALTSETENPPAGSFLLQVGWGTGWNAKSLGPGLTRSPDFPSIRSEWLSGPAGRRRITSRPAGRTTDAPQQSRVQKDRPFPASRRLVEYGDSPVLPLGWVRVWLVAQDQELPPILAVPVAWRNEPLAQARVPTTAPDTGARGQAAPAAEGQPVARVEEPASPFARLQALLGEQTAVQKEAEETPQAPIATIRDRDIKPGLVILAEIVAIEERRVLVNVGRSEPAVLDANVLGGGNLPARFQVGQRLRVRVLAPPPFFRLRLA